MSKINPIKKAIINAGGRGSRLGSITANKPKCLIEVGGKTILQWQLESLRGCGITDIAVVRGYKKELIDVPKIKYYDDMDCKGILTGLFCAEPEMNSGFIFSYSDIIYQKEMIEKLLQNKSDIALAVDRDWRKHYINRRKHPMAEAELVKVENGEVTKIGKNVVGREEAYGEFIGLAGFSKKGAEILKKEYKILIKKYQNREDQKFQNALSFQRAYLTDMIQHLIDGGYSVSFADTAGSWIEIDTDEDLKVAKKIYKRSIIIKKH